SWLFSVTLPDIPDASEGERLGHWLEVMRLLRLGVDFLPLVPAARRHEAAALFEWLAIRRSSLDPIVTGVDHAVRLLPELVRLQPERHQAPASHDQLSA